MTRETRKQKVLKVLSDNEWHAGYELTRASTGGSEGLRRLRELRADGYNIEGPRSMKGRTTMLYRLRTP